MLLGDCLSGRGRVDKCRGCRGYRYCQGNRDGQDVQGGRGGRGHRYCRGDRDVRGCSLAPYRALGPRPGRCSLTSYRTKGEGSEGCSLTTYRSRMRVEGKGRSELGRVTTKEKSF